jgi:hypothetical protein
MMLVAADRVEAALGDEFELVHEVVVHCVGAARTVEDLLAERGLDLFCQTGSVADLFAWSRAIHP